MSLFVRLLLTTVLMHKLHSKILRLPCITEADFNIFHVGKRLYGSVIQTHHGTSDVQCMIHCIRNDKCRSYNINKSDNICEINGEYVNESDDKLRNEADWVYKSTDYNQTLIGPTCKESKPCGKGVLCQETCSAPFYECVHCNEKFTGLHCDIPVDKDDCTDGLCMNNDQCIDKIHDYECKCRIGYTGKNCEIDIDECASLPCFNGGTCNNIIGNFTCNCLTGYSGLQCEIENIAYKRNSSQSSLHAYAGISLIASNGNDGNRDGNWEVCAWTTSDHDPAWWRVDLGRIAAVKYIIIRSGTTFGQTTINPFYISIGNDGSNGGTNNPLCVDEGTVTAGEIKTFYCSTTMQGRYVTVFLRRLEYLQVCELEVYE